MDSFNFGTPTRGPQLNARTMTYVGIVIVALLIVVIAFLQLTGSGGEAATTAATASAPTASPVNPALDVQAKASARAAEGAASAAYQASGGFSTVGPQQLSILDPSVTYTTGPSTSATVVSVASTAAAWGAAVLGPSGTCYWVTLNVLTVPHYGTGSTCSGTAAMAADRSHW